MKEFPTSSKSMKIALIVLWAVANIALCADIHIVVGKAISENSQLGIDQLKKCGTSYDGTSSINGKSSPTKITRMYYSREAHVFIEVVTIDGIVDKVMWQRFDPDDENLGGGDFTESSEVRIKGAQFTSTNITVNR